jgi:exonuclease III
MSRSLLIISHNIQGLSSQIHTEIKHFIDNNPYIDILCIQDTKMNSNKEKSNNGYTSEYKNKKKLFIVKI